MLVTIGPAVSPERLRGVGLGRRGRRPAGRPAAAVGGRHRRRRPDHRDQPVRPARRGERQEGRPRHAGGRAEHAHRRRSPTARWRCAPRRRLLSDEKSVADAVHALLGQLDDEHGYLAVMAYLDRAGTRDLAGVRESLAGAPAEPTTFGWGPRFLHSTGQFHKGGPPDRCLPADHRRARRGPRDPRTSVHLRRVHRAQADRGRPRAGRPRPPGAAAAPDRPRRRPGVARSCGRPAAVTTGDRTGRSGPTRSGTPRTGGCRASPARAGWCCSASPATCRARR